ncbi:MAG: hypothetical protein WDM89_09795 [Rhizomicrobium sp.]
MVTPDGVSMADESARDLKDRLAKQPLSALMKSDTNTLESMRRPAAG